MLVLVVLGRIASSTVANTGTSTMTEITTMARTATTGRRCGFAVSGCSAPVRGRRSLGRPVSCRMAIRSPPFGSGGRGRRTPPPGPTSS